MRPALVEERSPATAHEPLDMVHGAIERHTLVSPPPGQQDAHALRGC